MNQDPGDKVHRHHAQIKALFGHYLQGGHRDSLNTIASLIARDLNLEESPATLREIEAILRPLAPGTMEQRQEKAFDYDDVVEQSFPASDPPPSP
ncbi:MAG: hypothetical protein WD535_05125 [Thermaerobacterales bacterium]